MPARGINAPTDDLLFPINHGVLFHPSDDVLLPFVGNQADRMDDDGFRVTSDRMRDRMRALFTDEPVPDRRHNAGDDAIPSTELRKKAAASILTGFAALLRI